MSEDIRHDHEPWGSRMKFVLIGFALIGGFFLLAEHRAHVLPYLPWLFLGGCLVMHMFMHGGHGHGSHGGHGGDATGSQGTTRIDAPAEDSRADRATTGDAAAGTLGTGSNKPKTATPGPDHSHHHGGGQS